MEEESPNATKDLERLLKEEFAVLVKERGDFLELAEGGPLGGNDPLAPRLGWIQSMIASVSFYKGLDGTISRDFINMASKRISNVVADIYVMLTMPETGAENERIKNFQPFFLFVRSYVFRLAQYYEAFFLDMIKYSSLSPSSGTGLVQARTVVCTREWFYDFLVHSILEAFKNTSNDKEFNSLAMAMRFIENTAAIREEREWTIDFVRNPLLHPRPAKEKEGVIETHVHKFDRNDANANLAFLVALVYYDIWMYSFLDITDGHDNSRKWQAVDVTVPLESWKRNDLHERLRASSSDHSGPLGALRYFARVGGDLETCSLALKVSQCANRFRDPPKETCLNLLETETVSQRSASDYVLKNMKLILGEPLTDRDREEERGGRGLAQTLDDSVSAIVWDGIVQAMVFIKTQTERLVSYKDVPSGHETNARANKSKFKVSVEPGIDINWHALKFITSLGRRIALAVASSPSWQSHYSPPTASISGNTEADFTNFLDRVTLIANRVVADHFTRMMASVMRRIHFPMGYTGDRPVPYLVERPVTFVYMDDAIGLPLNDYIAPKIDLPVPIWNVSSMIDPTDILNLYQPLKRLLKSGTISKDEYHEAVVNVDKCARMLGSFYGMMELHNSWVVLHAMAPLGSEMESLHGIDPYKGGGPKFLHGDPAFINFTRIATVELLYEYLDNDGEFIHRLVLERYVIPTGVSGGDALSSEVQVESDDSAIRRFVISKIGVARIRELAARPDDIELEKAVPPLLTEDRSIYHLDPNILNYYNGVLAFMDNPLIFTNLYLILAKYNNNVKGMNLSEMASSQWTHPHQKHMYEREFLRRIVFASHLKSIKSQRELGKYVSKEDLKVIGFHPQDVKDAMDKHAEGLAGGIDSNAVYEYMKGLKEKMILAMVELSAMMTNNHLYNQIELASMKGGIKIVDPIKFKMTLKDLVHEARRGLL